MFDKTILFFLPMILFLGIITSYEDIRYGKIKNKWIITALIYAIIINIAIIILYKLTEQPIRAGYFYELIATVVFSLVFGVIFWYVGLWTPGDAKLFTAFSALVPLSIYEHGYMPYFPSGTIIINTMVPIFLFYTFLLMYKTTVKQKMYYLKKSMDLKKLFYIFIFMFAIIWPVSLFFDYFKITTNYFFTTLILFILIYLLEKVFKSKFLFFGIALAILRLLFDKTALNPQTIINFLVLFFVFIFFRFFILTLSYDFFIEHVDIKKLKKGMIPAKNFYIENNRYIKENVLFFNLIKESTGSTKKYIIKSTPEGLTEDDIKKLNQLSLELKFEYVGISKTLSFAPYLFFGVIITILLQGDIFISLIMMF
jgi:hypothetical protein